MLHATTQVQDENTCERFEQTGIVLHWLSLVIDGPNGRCCCPLWSQRRVEGLPYNAQRRGGKGSAGENMIFSGIIYSMDTAVAVNVL